MVTMSALIAWRHLSLGVDARTLDAHWDTSLSWRNRACRLSLMTRYRRYVVEGDVPWHAVRRDEVGARGKRDAEA